MKYFYKLLSLGLMLVIPFYYFYPDNELLKGLMLGNEFIHWAQLLLSPLVFGMLSVTVMKKMHADKTKKGKEAWAKMKKTYDKLRYEPNWRAFMNAVDWISLAFLVLFLNDWSFSIALLLSIFVVNAIEGAKNRTIDAYEAINKKSNAKKKN